jgi:hypothetical protein
MSRSSTQTSGRLLKLVSQVLEIRKVALQHGEELGRCHCIVVVDEPVPNAGDFHESIGEFNT